MKHNAYTLHLFLWVHYFFFAQAFGCKRWFASRRLFSQSSDSSAESNDDGTSAMKNGEDGESRLCRFHGCSYIVASRRGFLVLASSTAASATLSRQLPFSSSPKIGSSELFPFSTRRRYKSVQLSNGMRCVLVRSKSYAFSDFRQLALIKFHDSNHIEGERKNCKPEYRMSMH